jgi:hypothetical protein
MHPSGWFASLALVGVLVGCGSEPGAPESKAGDGNVTTQTFEEGTASSWSTNTGISSTLTGGDGNIHATASWLRATGTFEWTVDEEGGRTLTGSGSFATTDVEAQNLLLHNLWTSPPRHEEAAYCYVSVRRNDASCFSGMTCCIAGPCNNFAYGACD